MSITYQPVDGIYEIEDGDIVTFQTDNEDIISGIAKWRNDGEDLYVDNENVYSILDSSNNKSVYLSGWRGSNGRMPDISSELTRIAEALESIHARMPHN